MNCDEAAEKVMDILNTDFAILKTTKGYFLKFFIETKNGLREKTESRAESLPELFKSVLKKEVIFCLPAEALVEQLYQLLFARCVTFELRVWDGNIGPKEKGWSVWLVSPDGEMKYSEMSCEKTLTQAILKAVEAFEKALAYHQMFID